MVLNTAVRALRPAFLSLAKMKANPRPKAQNRMGNRTPVTSPASIHPLFKKTTPTPKTSAGKTPCIALLKAVPRAIQKAAVSSDAESAARTALYLSLTTCSSPKACTVRMLANASCMISPVCVPESAVVSRPSASIEPRARNGRAPMITRVMIHERRRAMPIPVIAHTMICRTWAKDSPVKAEINGTSVANRLLSKPVDLASNHPISWRSIARKHSPRSCLLMDSLITRTPHCISTIPTSVPTPMPTW
mmetsp:Transcript_20790/g.45709  ORF Transcript_20790/g.45709 Transcript_20790/m.45709 type:complete len:248 (-) Transcript_20790:157-900(-)